MSPGPVIEASGIDKTFGGTHALRGVSLPLRSGSIHGLIGENGAGKSTLIKILAGVHAPDAGEVRVDGRAVQLVSVHAARAQGVSTIFQEFILLHDLSVAENVFLGREPRARGRVDRARMEAETTRVLAELGVEVDPAAAVGTLGVAEQQMIEVAKGIIADARVFVFDEPTAALSRAEVERLHARIRQLRDAGRAVLYVSHRLEEVLALTDAVTVMKDGAVVTTLETGEATHDRLIALMVGRDVSELYPRGAGAPGAPALSATGVRAAGVPGPVDLVLREGEIVGLAGLEGQGQRALMRALYGDRPREGRVTAHGVPLPSGNLRAAIRAGLALLPEDRKTEGIFPSLDVASNVLCVAHGLRPLGLPARRNRGAVERVIEQMHVQAQGPGQVVASLSGGNQQKLLLGRWTAVNARILLCEEPTRGVDVGSKVEVYRVLREMADGGAAILVTSRELPELLGLCDRLIVMYGGRVTAELDALDATEERVMQAAVGTAA